MKGNRKFAIASAAFKCAGSIAVLSAVMCQPAWAQTATAPAAEQGSLGLEDIVVTAQRRSQNLQDVPVSVTAFTGASLQQRGISQVTDLSQVDSSLQITSASGTVIPFLRGVGNPSGETAGNEASVPVYIDDVYYTRLYTAYLKLANVDRVEVLKGPQGTLFGRNASGGLMQIFTRDPSTSKMALDATVGYGNYDTWTGQLYVSTPLGENAAIDLSAAGSDQKNGWGTNLFTGGESWRTKDYNLRSKLIVNLGETTKIRLSGFYAHQRSDVGVVGGVYQGYQRGLPPTYTAPLPEMGFYDVNTDAPRYTNHRGYGGSLKIDQELGFADFVSISSYRKARETFRSEGDQTYVDFLKYTLNIRDRQITQELQLKSKSDSAIQWILGGYYLNSRQGYLPTEIGGGAIRASGLETIRYFGQSTIKSYATFGQATFPVVDDKTNITLGLRYTWDNVLGEGRQRGFITGVGEIPIGVPDYRQRVRFKKLTYKVVTDHKFGDDTMAYLSFSRGYKSGTFNTLPLDAPPTRPETVDAYEIGLKNQFFDRRVRLNLAIFQNDIKNPQVQLIKNVAGVASAQFANAQKARTKGVEMDATFVLAQGLTLRTAGQYLSAKYIKFTGAPFNDPVFGPPYGTSTRDCIPAAECDASGNRMPRAPRWKLNTGINYAVPTDFADLNFDVNMAYRSNYKWDNDNFLTAKSLALFNTSITVKPSFNPSLAVRFWVTNLTDKKSYITELPQSGGVGYMTAPAAPRMYGIEVRYTL